MRQIGGVAAERKMHINRVAVNADITQRVPDRQPVKWRVRFHLSPSRLSLQPLNHLGDVTHIDVDPRGVLAGLCVHLRIAGDEQRQNRLYPCGAGFGRGGQHNVAIARLKRLPTGGIGDGFPVDLDRRPPRHVHCLAPSPFVAVLLPGPYGRLPA
ncbi:hypothetical protein PM02_10330 [Sulfitobacter mediterraneus]|uniref:Uncharacterized protein n=1 Tax=Sulfitobacter mediterraneus TaxID=83219 RepID=A0A061SUA6_9RHOB|nr:hypothetical protein PM02_10330 [Sulfitobacter mediterraneus]